MNTRSQRLISCAALLLAAAALIPQAHAQGGVPLWTNLNGGAAVAVDSSGNVFVAGSSYDSSGYSDYATTAYSGAGVPLWTNRYNGPGNRDDSVSAIAVDNSGKVFVTGTSHVDSSIPGYATIAYSSAGMPLWTNRYDDGIHSSTAVGVAVDSSGNIIVAGYSTGSTLVDYVTVKYSGAGVPLWTNRYNGPANDVDYVHAIAVDGSGNVIVTGESAVPGPEVRDFATVKYSGAGVPLWTNLYNGPFNGPNFGNAVAVDSSSNVIVTGSSAGSGGSSDYATVKYSGAGVPLWTNRYNGPGNGEDDANAIAVDTSGNVIVTGSSIGSGGSSDYATVKYSGAGVPLWTNRYNGPANAFDNAYSIAVDSSCNVFVTGSSRSSGGSSQYATIAYSGAGVPLWTNRYPGIGNFGGSAGAVAVDSNGNVIVTGSSPGSSNNAATIKYSSSIPAPHLDFQRLNHQLVLNWTNVGFTLQSAPDLTATFTNLPAATSPFTNPLTAPQQFFRLKGN